MNLSISNIAWTAQDDETVYKWMSELGYTGLEIAPTRIFPEAPYDHVAEARDWARSLYEMHGFRVSSMQSIWYGRKEKVFGTETDRNILTDYTKRAIDFAQAIDCSNLVFGSPVNRQVPEGMSSSETMDLAVSFFKPLGAYARACGTHLSMEANPPMYNTNFINDTRAALKLIATVGEQGFGLNLDVGTMVANDEQQDIDLTQSLNHVHISEPGLSPIEHRDLHGELLRYLYEAGYDRFVSIEMGNQNDLTPVRQAMEYLHSYEAKSIKRLPK